MRSKRVLRTAGYIAFGAASLLFFFYVTFPAQAVGQRIATEIQRRSDGKVSVAFDDVSLYRFSGIEAERVKIRTTSEQGDKPVEFPIEALHLRVQLLPLLLFNVALSAGVDIGEGSIEGELSIDDDGYGVELELEDVDLSASPLLSSVSGLPLRGVIGGTLEAKLGLAPQRRPGGQKGPDRFVPEHSEGEAKLALNNLSVGPGTLSGFTIPEPISFGQLDVTLDMRRGRARIAQFQQKGGQVALQASGSVSMRPTLSASTLDTCLKVKFADEEYLAKHPKIATALQLAEVQLQKDGEGFLHLKYTGSLSRPRRQRGLCRSTPAGSSRSERGRGSRPATK